MRFSLLAAAAVAVLSVSACAQTAVLDTSMGRLTCRLFSEDKPKTVAVFTGMATGALATDGRPLFDGTALRGGPDALTIAARPRAQTTTQEALETGAEERKFDAPGLLAMVGENGRMSPRLMVVAHANAEADAPNRVIFGQCMGGSAGVVQAAAHRLMAVDNDASAGVVLQHITVVPEGQPLPASPEVQPLPPLKTPPLHGPQPTGPTAVFETSMGSLSCKLFAKESPLAVATFVGLAEGTKEWTHPGTHAVQRGVRFYDGIVFDRVLPDFVIQTGDITNDPSGNTDIGFRFPNEDTPGLTYDRPGRLAFGNGGKDTNNSELFFTEHAVHRLDGGFTIIGQCDDASVKRIEAIARVPRDEHNRPLTPVVIRKVTVRR